MAKRRRKTALREPGDTPTPEQLAKGHYDHGTITHAETQTHARGFRSSHDPIKRWEKDGKLTDCQIATIERMQTLWLLVHGHERLTANHGERIQQTGDTETGAARRLALRDELRAIESLFDGMQQWYSVFERICRFGHAPVSVCGDRERALTTVQFIADYINTKGA